MNKMRNMYNEKLLLLTSKNELMILLRENLSTVSKDMAVARKKTACLLRREGSRKVTLRGNLNEGSSFTVGKRISMEITYQLAR